MHKNVELNVCGGLMEQRKEEERINLEHELNFFLVLHGLRVCIMGSRLISSQWENKKCFKATNYEYLESMRGKFMLLSFEI